MTIERRTVLQRWMATHERGPKWVAEQIGYSREWLSAVLHGHKPFSDKLARQLSELLGLSFDAPGEEADLGHDAPPAFVANPDPRCACVLLLDTSMSMQGPKMAALNEGLQTFRAALCTESLAARRVDIALITFDSQVQVRQDFVTVDHFAPPTLRAQGVTRMGKAILTALDLLATRRAQYQRYGVAFYRPWCFMVTDGEPEGEAKRIVTSAAQRLKDAEADQRVSFFAVGVKGANMTRLSQIVVRPPVPLAGLDFGAMFLWLSTSLQTVVHSRLDEKVPLPPLGWLAVEGAEAL